MDKDQSTENALNLETEKFYDAIDNDHHVWHDSVDAETRVIGDDFQNGIKVIHHYVDRVIRIKDPAFRIEHRAGKTLIRRTRLSNLPTGALVTQQFLETFEVSEQVRIFFEAERETEIAIEIVLNDLHRRDWHRTELLAANTANQFIELVRLKAASKEFKRPLAVRKSESNRRYRDGASLIDALFAKYSRLNVVRIDLSYKSHVQATLHRLKADFNRFLNNSRHNAIFSTTVGYIWRIEWAPNTGYHVHLMLFLDGANTPPWDGYTADQIGKYWISMTREDGRYYNCNFHKNEYKRLGIGVISHRDQSKREILLNDVLRYLTKKDELVRPRVPWKTKMFGTSQGPEEHSGLGRKRAT